jgi:hypothetical protein
MKRRQVAVWCALIMGASTGAAEAVLTVTPPVRSDEGDNLGCFVQNLSGGAVTVATAINNGLGTIVDSDSFAVPAGQAIQLSSTSSQVFGAYCTFDFDADPTAVRGFISLQDAGGSNTRLLYPAEPVDDGPAPLQVDIYSPPVRSSEGDNLLCYVQNLTNAPLQMFAELNNGLGTIVDDGTLTIEAGNAIVLASSNSQVFGAYCHFRFSGNPSQVRGYISLQDAGGSNTRLLYPAAAIAGVTAPTPTPTSSATLAVATATATATGDQTPSACCGDCNDDGQVRVDELVSAVNRALGGCPE